MLTAKEKEIVKRARRLIASKDHWTTSSFARAHNGRSVAVSSHGTYSFCAIGALRRPAFDFDCTPQGVEYYNFAAYIDRKLTGRRLGASLSSINDSKDGHGKVLALFDRALAQ